MIRNWTRMIPPQKTRTSELIGNSASSAIGLLYYQDSETFPIRSKFRHPAGTDAFSQVLKEFWSDIKRRLSKEHGAYNHT